MTSGSRIRKLFNCGLDGNQDYGGIVGSKNKTISSQEGDDGGRT